MKPLALLLWFTTAPVTVGCTDAKRPSQSDAHEVSSRRVQGVTTADLPALKEAARAGDANAQVALGKLLQHTAPAEGSSWLTKAALQGSAEAQFQLGLMHALGEGVPTDEKASDAWFMKAAAQGHVDAQVILGLGYQEQGRLADAFEMMKRAAQAGDPRAEKALATMYTNGEGTPQDDAEAVKWYTRAAEHGDATVLRLLGFVYCCRIPSTIPTDKVAALAWLTLAERVGDPEAAMLATTLTSTKAADVREARRRADAWWANHGAALKIPADFRARP